jgi:hypothetical protein
VSERLAPERRQEFGEVRQILLRFRIQPTLDRIGGECEDQDVEGPLLLVLTHGQEWSCAHVAFPAVSPRSNSQLLTGGAA